MKTSPPNPTATRYGHRHMAIRPSIPTLGIVGALLLAIVIACGKSDHSAFDDGTGKPDDSLTGEDGGTTFGPRPIIR